MFAVIDDYCIHKDTIAAIGQFATLWAMLEERYFDRCCSAPKLAKMNVVNVSGPLIVRVKELKEALLSYYSSIDDIIDRLCMRGKDKVFSGKVARFLKEDELDVSNAIYAAICICFRIRNNLFHGEKVLWLLNQQKPLLDSCSAFLNEVLLNEGTLQTDCDSQ